MGVVAHVAAGTIAGQVVSHTVRMTCSARQPCVGAVQPEIGLLTVVEVNFGPNANAMATAAVFAVSPLVNIVTLVAGVTVGTAEIGEISSTVAVLAGQTTVTTRQAETRHRQVIEGELGPARRVVARLAL